MADGVPVMLLITVSRPRSESVVRNLLGACRRKSYDVSVFFTGRGVQLLELPHRAVGLGNSRVRKLRSEGRRRHDRPALPLPKRPNHRVESE